MAQPGVAYKYLTISWVQFLKYKFQELELENKIIPKKLEEKKPIVTYPMHNVHCHKHAAQYGLQVHKDFLKIIRKKKAD